MSFDTQSTSSTHTPAEAQTADEALQTTGRDVTISLDCLFLSARNVRKVRHAESLPELAALIAPQGLLHRPSVTEAEDGRYSVEAGGRAGGGWRRVNCWWPKASTRPTSRSRHAAC